MKRRHIPTPNLRVRAENDGKGGTILWFELGPDASAVTFRLTLEEFIALLHDVAASASEKIERERAAKKNIKRKSTRTA